MRARFVQPLVVALVLALLLTACGSGAATDADTGASQSSDARDEWLRSAELGPYAGEQNWEEIEAAAREEGKVTVYSVSSRIFDLADGLEEKYGIELEAYDLSSAVQMERLKREQDAGQYVVDVIFNNETPLILGEFLPEGRVWNFVPSTVAEHLDSEEQEPMYTQRWTSRVLIYNSDTYRDGPPVDNLWDLTREEWRGKVQMPDPLTASVQGYALATILQHPEEMAAAYEAEFGEPLTEFSEIVQEIAEEPTFEMLAGSEPNAAVEWLYRLLQNDPVFVGSTSDIGDNVGKVGQDDPPLGITTLSNLDDLVPGEIEWAPATSVEPFFGVTFPTVLMIADQAPHPNAAKVLIRYMSEDGFEPWNVPGDYSARDDVAARQAEEFGIDAFDDLDLLRMDSEFVYSTKAAFLELYLELRD